MTTTGAQRWQVKVTSDTTPYQSSIHYFYCYDEAYQCYEKYNRLKEYHATLTEAV